MKCIRSILRSIYAKLQRLVLNFINLFTKNATIPTAIKQCISRCIVCTSLHEPYKKRRTLRIQNSHNDVISHVDLHRTCSEFEWRGKCLIFLLHAVLQNEKVHIPPLHIWGEHNLWTWTIPGDEVLSTCWKYLRVFLQLQFVEVTACAYLSQSHQKWSRWPPHRRHYVPLWSQ